MAPSDQSSPVGILRAVLLSRRALTPRLLRLTLGGPELAGYPTTGVGDEYVRLFLPEDPGGDPALPTPVGRGWEFPEGVPPAPMRTYTVRSHRPGQVDLDVVLHGEGPAARWARDAPVGSTVGLSTPLAGRQRPPAVQRQLLVADAAGLPALARILEENTPPEVSTRVLCEVAAAEEVLELPSRGPVQVTWSVRSGNGVGPSTLPAQVRRTRIEADGGEWVWVAGEAAMTREVRRHLRTALGLPVPCYTVVGYWTDRAESWHARYARLPETARDRFDRLFAEYDREGGRPWEEVLDEIDALYREHGL